MAFFDVVKDKAKDLGDKAKDLGDVGKNKFKIAEAESDIKKLLEEIAKDILANKPEFLQENYPEQFAKIGEFQASIEALKAQIEEIKKD